MAASRMSSSFDYHVPVLLWESVSTLITNPDGVYVDATFGRGNHTESMLSKLSPAGRIIVLDKDEEAICFAKKRYAAEPRVIPYHSSFKHLKEVLKKHQLIGQIQGILFDLGVSSPQLDNAERGFSFMQSGTLDMRMDLTQPLNAMSWLASVEESVLADVLWRYGEEKRSRRIARAIVAERVLAPIETTQQLTQIIERAVPKRKNILDKHPATRSFQAIRIFINDELNELSSALEQALEALQVGGRLAVISFHSLEDRIVKHFIRKHEKGEEAPRHLPIKSTFISRLRTVVKPIRPNVQETTMNRRARSAVLRIAEKTS